MLGDPAVQGLRGDVGTVGPDDRSELFVQLDASEVSGILKWGEYPTPRFGREIQFPFDAILKSQAQAVPSTRLRCGDVNDLGHGIDARARGLSSNVGFAPCAFPVSFQLASAPDAAEGDRPRLQLRGMGSRYLFIVLYVWLEATLSRGDYRVREPGGGGTLGEGRQLKELLAIVGGL